MKKLTALIALLALTGNTAGAELLKNFSYDGKLEINSYQLSNINFNSDVKALKDNDVDVRVQLNAGFDLTEDAGAVLSVIKNNREYGDASEHSNTVQSNLFFEQAYMELKGVLGMDHKLGRQYYGEEDDVVIYYGPYNRPYPTGLPVSALDAWTGWYKNGALDLTILLGNMRNDFTATQDETLFGLTAGYALSGDTKVKGYAYRKVTQLGAAQPDDRLDVVGAKVSGKAMGFGYGAELARNFGRNNGAIAGNPTGYAGAGTSNSYKGALLRLSASYETDLSGRLLLTGEYIQDSGDGDTTDNKVRTFQPINPGYRRGIFAGGYLGVSPVSDTKHWNLGAEWHPASEERLTLGAKLMGFAPSKSREKSYSYYFNELNLSADWKHSDMFGVNLYLAMVMPDKEWVDILGGAANDGIDNGNGTDDTATLLGAAFTVKF